MHQKVYNWLRLIVLSLLTMISSITYAYDFEVEGLYYNIIASDKEETDCHTIKFTNTSNDYGTYYTLTIKVTGNGSVSLNFNNEICRNSTNYFSLHEGARYIVTCTPDLGYRIKNIKRNDSSTRATWARYCSNTIWRDETVEVEFEPIPSKAYTITINAIGNGHVLVYDGENHLRGMTEDGETYGEDVVRAERKTYTLHEGTGLYLWFQGDNGYVVRNLKINDEIVDPYSNYWNYDTIINDDIYIEVKFLDPSEVTLSIKANGPGSAVYNGEEIRGTSKTYTVKPLEGLTISFNPDEGSRIKSLIVNGIKQEVCSFIICSMLDDTSIEVEFEAIPSTTYALTISASGNGSASYGGETIRGNTKTYTVNEGISAIITFTPDNGYRIKSLVVNNTVVTASTSYTVTMNADTSVEVEFEAIPPTTYTLSITASGNGSASYGGENIRGATKTYTVNEGTSATITFTPDNGYRIKSLKVNNAAVTASTSYTVTVNANTTVSVEFEAIPATTYTLSIKATGNGSASYDGTAIRGTTKSFTVNEGTKAAITFTPDDGYQIKSLKVNNVAVTASTSYTATINSDTSVEVEFEAIPDIPKTYTLSIRAKGNGIATYNGEAIRETTKTYTLEEGTKVSMTFTPDEGNRIKGLRVNGEYQTVTDKYEGTITADTSIKIDFEEIPVDPEPPVTYTLSIKAIGSGTATYDEEVIRDNTSTFTLDEGTTGTIIFTPDEGYHIKSLMVNGSAISIDTNYSFTMTSDISVEVEFEETVVISKFSVDGLNYEVNSLEDHTVTLGAGDYGLVLEVPEKVTYNDEEWTVTGIVNDALVGAEELAAVIWNLETAFNAKVTNPNLLLYVKDEAYAPVNIKNVVVNSYASSISLTEAMSGNNFYCPVAFTAQSIEYTHNYLMKTGLNESRGWETIALPFDVQKISHSSKGEIVPFAKWTSGGSAKPFWLYELSGSGFVEAEAIKANTPYIISMPNNEAYPGEYQLTGRVTFSAENVEVKKSDEVQTATYSSNTFEPNFICRNDNAGYYALNVSNDYEYYRGAENEGSKFILNLRKIHPFEAYMTSTSGTRSIDIFDSMTTGIRGIEDIGSLDKVVKVYDLSGRLIKTNTTMEAIRQELPAGVYIVNNRKMIIK